MKKNRMMRAASLLLVAVLLTTCTISGTFAKYTSSGTATDTARVAKWGVTVTAVGNEAMFDTDYTNVSSLNSDKVVAPGTSNGSPISFTVAGQPEVAGQITYAGTVTLTGWEVGAPAEYYCPLRVTVGTKTLSGLDYADAAAFKAAIEGEIGTHSQSFTAKTDLSGLSTDDLSISWEWPIADSTGILEPTKLQTNAKDTLLGNAYSAEVTINVTCTVEQVD